MTILQISILLFSAYAAAIYLGVVFNNIRKQHTILCSVTMKNKPATAKAIEDYIKTLLFTNMQLLAIILYNRLAHTVCVITTLYAIVMLLHPISPEYIIRAETILALLYATLIVFVIKAFRWKVIDL